MIFTTITQPSEDKKASPKEILHSVAHKTHIQDFSVTFVSSQHKVPGDEEWRHINDWLDLVKAKFSNLKIESKIYRKSTLNSGTLYDKDGHLIKR